MKLSDLNSRKLTDQEYQEIKKLVYEYPTRNQYGFLADEQKALIDKVNKQ